MAERFDLIKSVGGEEGDRTTQAIRRDIAARRDSITDTVDELSDRVHAALDWRTYVAEHPFLAVGLTAGLTCTMLTLIKRRPSPQDRIMDALADGVEDLAGRFKDGLGTLPLMRRARIGRILWSIGSTIATAAVTKSLKKEAPSKMAEQSERRFESERGSFAARASSSGEAD